MQIVTAVPHAKFTDKNVLNVSFGPSTYCATEPQPKVIRRNVHRISDKNSRIKGFFKAQYFFVKSTKFL
jgi:hypothetical protein